MEYRGQQRKRLADILDVQAKHHPCLAEVRDEILDLMGVEEDGEIVDPRPKTKDGKELWESRVGHCSYLPNELRAETSNPEARQYHVREQIANLRINGLPLSHDQSATLYDRLSASPSLTRSEIRTLLGAAPGTLSLDGQEFLGKLIGGKPKEKPEGRYHFSVEYARRMNPLLAAGRPLEDARAEVVPAFAAVPSGYLPPTEAWLWNRGCYHPAVHRVLSTVRRLSLLLGARNMDAPTR